MDTASKVQKLEEQLEKAEKERVSTREKMADAIDKQWHQLQQERYERQRMQRKNVELRTQVTELRYERDLFRAELHRLHGERTKMQEEAEDF